MGKNLDANLVTIAWSTVNDHTNGHYGAIHLQADKLAEADNIGPRPIFQAGVSASGRYYWLWPAYRPADG